MTLVAQLWMIGAVLLTGHAAMGQANSVLAELPIVLLDGFVLLEARVNDSEKLNFLFDTGCTEAVVDSATAARLGLLTRLQSRTSGAGNYLEAVVDNARLTFGSLDLEPRRLLSRSNDLLERRFGITVDGVVGADLLNDFVVEIDYDRLLLKVYESEGYSYEGRGEPAAINANRYFSTLNGSLTVGDGKTLTGRFLIDTGAGVALAMNTPFVNEHDLITELGARHIEYRLSASGVEMLNHPGRVPVFRVGNYEFRNMPLLLSQTTEGPLSPGAIAGIIGNKIWSRFNTVYDYARGLMYLEPNGLFQEPFRVDCSGLGMERSDDRSIGVTRVVPDSPGSDAGISVGDRIVELNGHAASELTLHTIRTLLNNDGSVVTLVLLRGGDLIERALTLRALY